MDPSFGSFGDLVSIALLIKEIATALNDRRGSPKKYQVLIRGLDTLSTSVQEAEKLYSSQRFVTGVERCPMLALEQAITEVSQCLEDFYGRIRKYGSSLAPGGSGNLLKDAVRNM